MSSWLLKIIMSLTGMFYSHSFLPLTQVKDMPTTLIVRPQPVKPVNFYGFSLKGMRVIESQVKRNQRFVDMIKDYTVDSKIVRQLSLLPRSVFDFRKIKTHKPYSLLLYADSLNRVKALIYESTPLTYVVFYLEDTLVVEQRKHVVVKKEKMLTGIIESSLVETIQSLNMPYGIANQLVDIFAWQIDFQKLQKGDVFKVVYEEYNVKNKPVDLGKIKSAYFDHRHTEYWAFSFKQGKEWNYYDASGKSLHKVLLKYPIEFTRISSRYSRRRFHPVAKVFRAHLGTDFAAPRGTPVRAVGDGVVIEARYTLYNGNYVKIRHNDIYTTQYLHLSKIATGIRKGIKVYQKQKIGYVGRTGMATGTHLCYRFWKKGIQIDALKVRLPSSESIRKNHETKFLRGVIQAVKILEAIPTFEPLEGGV